MTTTPPRRYDCFTYNGEDELLWLRLETLKDHVDHFVIAEATRTFTGKPKPIRLDPGRFPSHAHKIIHLVVDDLEADPASPWDNERRQRNALGAAMLGSRRSDGLAPAEDDWVLLGDLDEIPRPDRLACYRPWRYLSAVLVQANYFYAFNNQAMPNGGQGRHDGLWRRARITTVRHLRRWYLTTQNVREFHSTSPLRSVLRQWNKLFTQQIDNGGWHFSYLMRPEQIIEKLGAFSHQEYNNPDIANLDFIRDRMARRLDLFSEGRFEVRPLDDSFPAPLRQARERYADFIW